MPMDKRRFRANVYVDLTSAQGFAENQFVGRSLRIGPKPRSDRAQKRGRGGAKIELDEAAIISPEQTKEIVDLREAKKRLSTLDSRKAQVVELKYFGGLNYDEIAEVLRTSSITVRSEWRFAKAWLYTELQKAT